MGDGSMMSGSGGTVGAGSGGGARVTFTPPADNDEVPRFHPQIMLAAGESRAFDPEDMQRVLDFEGIPGELSPPDCPLLVGEGDNPSMLNFSSYHCCLRGGYVFYFSSDDVDEDSGPYAIFVAPPVGVVPIENCQVQFPPGGRRVFREHAQTEARSGYEMVLLHSPPRQSQDDGEEVQEQLRPPAFLVCDSMNQRERWAKAIRERAALVNKPTLLRAYSAAAAAASKRVSIVAAAKDIAAAAAAAPADHDDAGSVGAAPSATAAATTAAAAATLADDHSPKKSRKSSSTFSSSAKSRQAKKLQEQVMEVKDDAELAQAVVEFGALEFDEKHWMDEYFAVHNDFDAPGQCRQMEQWQSEMKKSLKGAVLEQYEYFVQASGEMTTMGKEVTSLKNHIEFQLETIKTMKDIDFAVAVRSTKQFLGHGADEEDELDQPDQAGDENDPFDDERSIFSEVSALLGKGRGAGGRSTDNAKDKKNGKGSDEDAAPPIPVPEWLEDVADDIAAIAREGRYADAVDLHHKARAEVADLIDKHERPTLYKLTKKQLSDLRHLQRNLDHLGKRISGRLEETLRRKNEALRQASKRERSDPNATLTLISPCSINDDAHYLQLLCKLGKAQTAAEAYSARRSLLLLEALSEKPISGAGSVDLVIYAAQLSQSFFSCLANSVEGFLDCFMMSATASLSAADAHKNEDETSLADSSLHSISMQTKNAPSGAVASVVLWCDAELAKFAAAFGGTRILANLALSPPPRNDGPKKPRVVGGGPVDLESEGWKDRKNAIEVAAQCVDQAFLYATQNLDSVGLPLAPRLAEYIRVRLKGCEDEVSQLLDDRWQHLTADWRISTTSNGTNGLHGSRSGMNGY